MTCVNCQRSPGFYRCLTCSLGPRLLCKKCCIGVHQHNPFHKIQHWTGHFFNHTTLGDLGLTINLGHHGAPCPRNNHDGSRRQENVDDDDLSVDDEEDCTSKYHSMDNVTDVVFVDTSGVYQFQVRWCRCSTAATPDIQLLDMQFFPATSSQPSTAFTFAVLDQFYMDAMECKTNAYNFYGKLRRFTDNNFPHLVPVCS
jgi:hypothetical protein